MALKLPASPACGVCTAVCFRAYCSASPLDYAFRFRLLCQPEIRIAQALVGEHQRAGDRIRDVVSTAANMVDDILAAHSGLALQAGELAAENLIIEQGAGA